jgi:hypothetical protein
MPIQVLPFAVNDVARTVTRLLIVRMMAWTSAGPSLLQVGGSAVADEDCMKMKWTSLKPCAETTILVHWFLPSVGTTLPNAESRAVTLR